MQERNKLFECLSSRERHIYGRIMMGETITSVAKSMNRSIERIRQIYHKADLKMYKSAVKYSNSGKIQSKRNADDLWNVGLSTRTYNALVNAGIYSVSQLMSLSVEELREIRGISDVSVAEIEILHGGLPMEQ